MTTLARQNCLLPQTGPDFGEAKNAIRRHPIFPVKTVCRLTNYLKKVGKQDDLLGGPCPVRPVAEQRSRQEAAQAEC